MVSLAPGGTQGDRGEKGPMDDLEIVFARRQNRLNYGSSRSVVNSTPVCQALCRETPCAWAVSRSAAMSRAACSGTEDLHGPGGGNCASTARRRGAKSNRTQRKKCPKSVKARKKERRISLELRGMRQDHREAEMPQTLPTNEAGVPAPRSRPGVWGLARSGARA
jgi:hypothetical protein